MEKFNKNNVKKPKDVASKMKDKPATPIRKILNDIIENENARKKAKLKSKKF